MNDRIVHNIEDVVELERDAETIRVGDSSDNGYEEQIADGLFHGLKITREKGNRQ